MGKIISFIFGFMLATLLFYFTQFNNNNYNENYDPEVFMKYWKECKTQLSESNEQCRKQAIELSIKAFKQIKT